MLRFSIGQTEYFVSIDSTSNSLDGIATAIRHSSVPIDVSVRPGPKAGSWHLLLTAMAERLRIDADSADPALTAFAKQLDRSTRVLPNHAAIASADLTRDGIPDLVIAVPGARNRILIGLGNGKFRDASALLPSIRDWSTSVAVGDLDGDGRPDIVFGSSAPTRVFLATASGPYLEVRTALPAAFTHDVRIVDLDRDGRQDVVLATGFGPLAQPDYIGLGKGTGRFTAPKSPLLPATLSRVVELLDFDSDQRTDVLLGGSLYRSDAAKLLVDVTRSWLPGHPRLAHAQAVDIDGDGLVDLLATNGPRIRILRNSGNRFVDETALRIRDPFAADSLAACDIDGDQDVDFLAISSEHRARQFVNRERQLALDPSLKAPGDSELRIWSKPGYRETPAMCVLFAAARPGRVPLGTWGTFRLDPGSLFFAAPLKIPASGLLRIDLALPWQQVRHIVTQALILDPRRPSAGWRFTNAEWPR